MNREDVFRMKRYEDCIIRYGLIAVCSLLKEYEMNQKFEECQVILYAIQSHNQQTNQNLPTTYEGCMELLKNSSDVEYRYMLMEIPEDVVEIKRYIKGA